MDRIGRRLRARPEIIVMGASAGGVEALQTVLSGLPSDFPAAVLVVVHTSPEEKSHLADVFNRNGNIRAVNALNGSVIVLRHVYVAQPNHHLTVANKRMWLTVGPKVNRHRPAIDPLFESAAKAYGDRVIGVVLTGYLDDGSAGLVAIKKHGGIAIVQDPKEAFAPNMPRNALRTAKPDYCLRVEEIAPAVVRLTTGRGTRKEGRN